MPCTRRQTLCFARERPCWARGKAQRKQERRFLCLCGGKKDVSCFCVVFFSFFAIEGGVNLSGQEGNGVVQWHNFQKLSYTVRAPARLNIRYEWRRLVVENFLRRGVFFAKRHKTLPNKCHSFSVKPPSMGWEASCTKKSARVTEN